MRRSGWVVVLAVVGLGLTGCSDPGTPSDTLPTAASTSAEPTLAPLGPADFPVPTQAREDSEDGALAMASYYLNLLDFMKAEVSMADFSTSELRALSVDCEVCDQVADGLDNANASGYTYVGGDLEEPTIGAVTFAAASADIAFTVSQGAAQVVQNDGQEVRSSDPTLLRGGIVLEWSDERQAWIAIQLNLTN